jgi:hypothetical protein
VNKIGRSMERFDQKSNLKRKERNKMKKLVLTLATIACCALAGQAYADSIGFVGSSSASGFSNVTSPTTVSFKNPFTVVASDGIFAGTNGSATTMSSYTFTGDGATAVCTTCPQVQWTFNSGGNTYTFNLTSLTNAATRSGSISASGIGTVTIVGGPNAGTYGGTWAMNGTGSGTSYGLTFVTTTVPDGGSAVALLGIALTGIEAGRRLIRSRKA